MSGGYDLNGDYYANKRDAINAENAQFNEIDNRIDGQRISYLENKIRKLESELDKQHVKQLKLSDLVEAERIARENMPVKIKWELNEKDSMTNVPQWIIEAMIEFKKG